ncbi:MAG TPA: hypothetical protein PK402_01595 [Tepidisphaeraceae bacterium]|nr:hypothetical protein [Tepidisphaeraceae bacterium]
MNRFATLFIATALGTSSIALAHGPQTQLTLDNNQITTRNIFADEPYREDLTPATGVYVMPIMPSTGSSGTEWYVRPITTLNSSNQPVYLSGPGLAWGYGINESTGQTVWPTGGTFSMAFTGGLKSWDGSAFVDPGTEQLQLFRQSGPTVIGSAVTQDSGPQQPGVVSGAVSVNPSSLEPHTSFRYRLLGDGTNQFSASDDGVYLASFQLSMTNQTSTNILPSEEYFYVLAKNVSMDEATSIAQATFPNLTIQTIPEPTVLGLAGLMGLVSLRRVRR